ncbi:hypothetical protein RCL_jg12222.t1 [Rhizophagus clarus]|uniref:Uncharacterized protein n=1 Tax=Rhizophagus clarus TaxID=94130 RepID=A0A8H3L240_9GLOM|nr:hypothetical protein RCL_jg12222.t1 [Rhizophagus clarus]
MPNDQGILYPRKKPVKLSSRGLYMFGRWSHKVFESMHACVTFSILDKANTDGIRYIYLIKKNHSRISRLYHMHVDLDRKIYFTVTDEKLSLQSLDHLSIGRILSCVILRLSFDHARVYRRKRNQEQHVKR